MYCFVRVSPLDKASVWLLRKKKKERNCVLECCSLFVCLFLKIEEFESKLRFGFFNWKVHIVLSFLYFLSSQTGRLVWWH